MIYYNARATARHILAHADTIPGGDTGFEHLMAEAFAFAEDLLKGSEPVKANRAAILALGTILGDEKVADVAKRTIDPSRLPEIEALRKRITLYGRDDLPRHFWVSAALTVLSDDTRSMTVGLTKEMMDSNGGSGFSFIDLTADQAGTLLTITATRDVDSASNLQELIQSGVKQADYMPDVHDLPEGITSDEFQSAYGGLGGEETNRIVGDIRNRLKACKGLQL